MSCGSCALNKNCPSCAAAPKKPGFDPRHILYGLAGAAVIFAFVQQCSDMTEKKMPKKSSAKIDMNCLHPE